jgi:hypothetical protein
MPEQKRALLTKRPGDIGYWADFADQLPSRCKTRAAAEVAAKMEANGGKGVTPEIQAILLKVVALAGGA